MTWERLRRILWAPHPREERPRCPVCDSEVVGWPGMRDARVGYWEPTREELVAHCPEHGKPPYNQP